MALDAFPVTFQSALDQYMSGNVSDATLKAMVEFWPAGLWQEYLPLLQYCRAAGVRLMACGTPPEVGQPYAISSLQQRHPSLHGWLKFICESGAAHNSIAGNPRSKSIGQEEICTAGGRRIRRCFDSAHRPARARGCYSQCCRWSGPLPILSSAYRRRSRNDSGEATRSSFTLENPGSQEWLLMDASVHRLWRREW